MATKSQKTKLPLSEVVPVANRLAATLAHHCLRIEIAGSVRRMRPECGDIEIVAVARVEERMVASQHPDLFGPPLRKTMVHSLWRHLENIGTRFTKNGPRYRQFTHEGIQVDLFSATESNWGLILMIRTGPAQFSKGMMVKLGRAGYVCRDGRVLRGEGGPEVPTPEEADVFMLAREPWKDPENRW